MDLAEARGRYQFDEIPSRTLLPLLISFIGLSRYARMARERDNREMAELLNNFYCRIYSAITDAGGRVVKFMGDAALIVFREKRVDVGMTCLLSLKEDTDAWLESRGFGSRLAVKVHFGDVVAGPLGPSDGAHFDVIGHGANIAATLGSRGFTISPQVFRKLRPELRRWFKKHSETAVYVTIDEPRETRISRL